MYRDFIYKEINRDRSRNEIVNIDPETNIEETFRFGGTIHVAGSSTIIVPLYSDQEFALRYSGSKSTVSTRNLLFTDLRKEKSEWLLPTNNYLIGSHRLINRSNFYDRNEEVITILYQIVKSDANNDSRLSLNDRQTIALSRPDGSKFSEIEKDVDDLLGYEVIDQQAIVILYYQYGAGYTAYIDLTNFEVIKKIELPNIK